MTFDEYQAAVEYAHDHNPEWRRGQAAFNVLMLNRPDLSERVRATNIDPFHNDNLLAAFYVWVRDSWSPIDQPKVDQSTSSLKEKEYNKMKSLTLLIALIVLTFSSSTQAIQGCKTLNDKAISLAQPEYPVEARKAGQQGTVIVHIEVDEKGNVFAAQASPKRNVSLLMEPAEQAAKKSKFPAGRLSGDLHFTFVIQDAAARGVIR